MERVFISYSRRNKNFAERIARDLSDAGMDVWVDFRQIHAGEMWEKEIIRGLERSGIVVTCLSPAFLASEWCTREAIMARDQKKLIIPIMVVDSQQGLADSVDLNWLLAVQFINFEGRYEAAFPELLNALPGKRRVNVFDDIPVENIPNPFKGLESFQQTDAAFFFGRENLVQKAVKQLQEAQKARFLPVLGASGSGKSSLVRAGIIPRIRQGAIPGSEKWRLAIFTPGEHPVEALAVRLSPLLEDRDAAAIETALDDTHNSLHELTEEILSGTSPEVRLVLVVDQFEEVFTRSGERETEWFLQLLHHAATVPDGRTMIVITMRADFFDRLGRYPQIAELFEQEHMVIVTEMSSANLLRTIEGPASAVGLEYEDGLSARILDDVRRQPGSLPLLQHALNLLYARRSGRLLTHAAYDEIGGVQKALARHAETVYAGLGQAQQDVVRRVLLRLVEVSETGEATRRRVIREEMRFTGVSDATVQEVIELLTAPNVRLLIASREIAASDEFDAAPVTRLEVCHEALIREWERFKNWIADDEANLRFSTEMLKAAADWQNSKRDPAYLLSGSRLLRAEEWLSIADVSAAQREFIRASIERQEQIEAEKSAQAERELGLQRTAATRLRILAVVLVAALGVAIVLTVFALQAQREAADAAQRAEQAAAEAIANEQRAAENAAQARSFALAANAERSLANDEGDLAVALAVDSALVVNDPPPESRLSLANVAFAPGARRRFDTGAVVNAVALSPDGRRAFIGSEAGEVRLWDAATGDVIATYSVPATPGVSIVRAVTDLAVLPDGERIVVATGSGDVLLLTLDLQRVVEIFRGGHTRSVTSVALDASGSRLITGSTDARAVVWEVISGDPQQTLTGHTSGLIAAVFDPRRADRAVTVARDGRMIAWNLVTGLPEAEFALPQTPVSAAFSADGRFAVIGSARGIVELWSLGEAAAFAPQLVRSFTGISEESTVRAVTFSPAGDLVAAGGSDETVVLWNRETGERVRFLTGHERDVNDLLFSEDGTRIVSGSRDLTARIWDLTSAAIVRDFSGHTAAAVGRFVPGDRAVISASDDRTLRLWDTATGRVIAEYTGHDQPVSALDVSPDGRYALSGSRDTTVRLWDLAGGGVTVLTGHTDAVNAVRFLPDSGGGQRAISTGRDGALIIWDVEGGRELSRLTSAQRPASGALYAIDISPDGTLLAAGGDDQVVTIWNIAGSTVVNTLRGHGRSIRAVAFSPDGASVVSGTVNGDLFLWDIATGAVVRTFTGHNRTIQSLAFSPDGASILSASIDGSIRVWDVNSGFALRIYTLEDRLVTFANVTFSANGETILSGLSDGRLRLWRLYPTVESLLAWTLGNRFVPELTCDQRVQFRLPPFCDADNPQIIRDVPELPPLAPLPETLLALNAGDEAVVHVTSGDNLFLRSSPTVNSAETIVSRMPDGTRVTLLEGPQRSEGFTWWRLRTENGSEGWAVAFLPSGANDGLGELQTLRPADLFAHLIP